jgi:hypothetical protein
MWRTMIYGLLMWAVTIYAFRRGGWAEKLAASGIVVGSYLSALLLSPHAVQFRQVEASVVFVDLGLLFLLIVIGMRSTKFWPLWLTAFQGVTILAHFAPYVHVSPWVYGRAASLWSWPSLIVLGFGIYNHNRSKTAGDRPAR